MNPIVKSLKDLEALGTLRKGAADEVVNEIAQTMGVLDKTANRGPKGIMDFVLGTLRDPASRFVAAGTGLATVGVAGAVQSSVMKSKHNEVARELKQDPDVKSDPKRAERIYGMMIRYAPGLASDPIVAKATVKSLMTMPESFLTYDVAKKLTEAEKEYDLTHGLLAKFKKVF